MLNLDQFLLLAYGFLSDGLGACVSVPILTPAYATIHKFVLFHTRMYLKELLIVEETLVLVVRTSNIGIFFISIRL